MALMTQQITFLNDSIGRIVPSAKIFSYEINDENTPKSLYLDKDLTTLAPWPLVATAGGVFPQIYGDGQYLFVYTDENEVELHRRNIDSNPLDIGDGGILTTPTNGAAIDESDPDLILTGGLWDVLISGANAPAGETQPIRGMMIVINQEGEGDTYQRFYSMETGVTYESSVSDRQGGGQRKWFTQISSENFNNFSSNFALANGTQSYTGNKNYTAGTITYDGNTIALTNSADMTFDATSTITVGDMTAVTAPLYGPLTVANYAAFNGPIGIRDITGGGVDRDILNISGVFNWSGDINCGAGIVWGASTMQPTVAAGLNVVRNMKYTAMAALADSATTAAANVSFVKFSSGGAITVTSVATGTTWKNISGGTINQNETGMFIRTV